MNPGQDASTPGHQPGVASLRLLAVDDDPAEFELLERAFRSWVQVPDMRTATTAPMAMVELRQGSAADRPDVAIVDVNMPMVSGFELASLLITESIPTFLISAHVDEARRSRAMAIGAWGIYQKPADMAGYVAMAKSIVHRLGVM